MTLNPRPARRRGITLVELLMVVAVLAVLMAMLLPAVQHFRSSARRVDCGNNLRQLAAALHGFESQNGSLPPSWGSFPTYARGSVVGGQVSTTDTPAFGSWIAHILPFLDMNVEYARLPKAKICLGYRKRGDVPNSGGGGEELNYDDAVQRTAEDGITFNIHGINLHGGDMGLTGNNVSTLSGTQIIVWTSPGGTITRPTYTMVPDTVFASNGKTYTVWRQVITGSTTVVVPASSSTSVRIGNAVDNLSWKLPTGAAMSAGFKQTYFNLTKYPAAQETIRVPHVVCKGDNSVIESSRMLPWLKSPADAGARGWSTTNYMANPFAFWNVSNTEAIVDLRNPANSPDGWGRYAVFSGGPKQSAAMPDGTSSTILLAEAMRYCNTLVEINSQSRVAAPPSPVVEMARLAFWSSPGLVTPYDMLTDRPDPNRFPWTPTRFLALAIQPHPLSATGTRELTGHWGLFVGSQQTWAANPVPPEVSWKPWTHNFGVEWEARGRVNSFYANTFFFQTQPRPEQCSAFRAQSNHGNVLMVAMADGSVKPIQSSISRREVTDADLSGKQLGSSPNMGNQGTPDGTWDRLMRDNDRGSVIGF